MCCVNTARMLTKSSEGRIGLTPNWLKDGQALYTILFAANACPAEESIGRKGIPVEFVEELFYILLSGLLSNHRPFVCWQVRQHQRAPPFCPASILSCLQTGNPQHLQRDQTSRSVKSCVVPSQCKPHTFCACIVTSHAFRKGQC